MKIKRKVKIFYDRDYSNVEIKINDWLGRNPEIKVEQISSTGEKIVFLYQESENEK